MYLLVFKPETAIQSLIFPEFAVDMMLKSYERHQQPEVAHKEICKLRQVLNAALLEGEHSTLRSRLLKVIDVEKTLFQKINNIGGLIFVGIVALGGIWGQSLRYERQNI